MTKQDTTASAMKITWMTAGENFWLKNTITKGCKQGEGDRRETEVV